MRTTRLGLKALVLLSLCYIVPVSAQPIVTGTVRFSDGSIAPGVIVQALDADTFSPDDFMGDDITDGDGRYYITYSEKKWDPKVGAAFGPDIYVQVIGLPCLKNLRKSKTRSNQASVPLEIHIVILGSPTCKCVYLTCTQR